MNRIAVSLSAALLVCLFDTCFFAAEPPRPICQHPENPSYFLWRGQAVALVTCAEHYGAVLNADFDYLRYLRTLNRYGFNYTRIFAGAYVEPVEPTGIRRNTLAPAHGRFLAPWARSDEPGYPGGGNKFDLSRFSPEYLNRLKAFISAAGELEIVVELTFFCSTYGGPVHGDTRWAMHPFNPNNNIQDFIVPDRRALHSTECPQAFPYQERLVRYLVAELREFDNLFFEMINEPLADNRSGQQIISYHMREDSKQHFLNKTGIPSKRSVQWQRRLAQIIAEEEKDLVHPHLIAQNISKLRYAVREDDYAPEVDLLNFHYALPEAVTWNLGHGKIIGFDETGFAGVSPADREDRPYRLGAWRFMMAGGGLFNHLDHTFNVGYEDGSDSESISRGGGSPELRQQISTLSRFIHSFDLTQLRPDPTRVLHCPGAATQVLSQGEDAHAVYFEGRGSTYMLIRPEKGRWTPYWVNPIRGNTISGQSFDHAGGNARLPVPTFSDRVLALRLVRDEEATHGRH